MDYGMRNPVDRLHGSGWEGFGQNLATGLVQTGQAVTGQAINYGMQQGQKELDKALGINQPKPKTSSWLPSFSGSASGSAKGGTPKWVYGLGAVVVIGGGLFFFYKKK